MGTFVLTQSQREKSEIITIGKRTRLIGQVHRYVKFNRLVCQWDFVFTQAQMGYVHIFCVLRDNESIDICSINHYSALNCVIIYMMETHYYCFI